MEEANNTTIIIVKKRRGRRDQKTMASNPDRLVGRFTEAALLKRAKEVVEEKSKTSTIFDEEAERQVPRFDKSGLYRSSLQLDL